MRISVMLVAALMSFSAFAATEQTGLRKLASVPLDVKTKGQLSSSIIVDVESGQTTIKRRSVAKKQRDVSSLTSQKIRAKQTRELSPKLSTKSSDFTIYNAWTELVYDADFDGFYSEFTVNFDVDVVSGYADVYADMYLSKDGGPWTYFNTTEDFTIYADDSGDYYSVTTGLNFDFPTGFYDVLIDVYEVGYAGIVATAGPNEFDGLYDLPLEDAVNENQATQISFVATDLADDIDGDGYFTNLLFEFDVETSEPGREVYTEIQLTNLTTLQRYTRRTESFGLGTQTEIVELILDAGYRTGLYDAEIRLVDAVTGQVLESAADDFSSLIDLPLESSEFDNRSGGGTGGGEVVIIEESGGGALYLWVLLLLGLVPFRRLGLKFKQD